MNVSISALSLPNCDKIYVAPYHANERHLLTKIRSLFSENTSETKRMCIGWAQAIWIYLNYPKSKKNLPKLKYLLKK